MNSLLPIISLVLGVLLVNAVAVKIGAPAPILLVATGLAVSFVPGVPSYEISPELVLTVLLPPLLYAAAVESSAVAIRQLLRPIFQLAVVLVLLTAFTVAFVLTALIPAIPFAAALALGAIVAPPDAVAAVALARRIGLPRRLVTVLEGESLFNDATSLVTLSDQVGTAGEEDERGELGRVGDVGDRVGARAVGQQDRGVLAHRLARVGQRRRGRGRVVEHLEPQLLGPRLQLHATARVDLVHGQPRAVGDRVRDPRLGADRCTDDDGNGVLVRTATGESETDQQEDWPKAVHGPS